MLLVALLPNSTYAFAYRMHSCHPIHTTTAVHKPAGHRPRRPRITHFAPNVHLAVNPQKHISCIRLTRSFRACGKAAKNAPCSYAKNDMLARSQHSEHPPPVALHMERMLPVPVHIPSSAPLSLSLQNPKTFPAASFSQEALVATASSASATPARPPAPAPAPPAPCPRDQGARLPSAPT